jgi:hypothetical protein
MRISNFAKLDETAASHSTNGNQLPKTIGFFLQTPYIIESACRREVAIAAAARPTLDLGNVFLFVAEIVRVAH